MESRMRRVAHFTSALVLGLGFLAPGNGMSSRADSLPSVGCPDKHGVIVDSAGNEVGRAVTKWLPDHDTISAVVPEGGSLKVNTPDGFVTTLAQGPLGMHRTDFPFTNMEWMTGSTVVQLVGPNICVTLMNKHTKDQDVTVKTGLETSLPNPPPPSLNVPCANALTGIYDQHDDGSAAWLYNQLIRRGESARVQTRGGTTTISAVTTSDDQLRTSDQEIEQVARLKSSQFDVTIYKYPGANGDEGRYPPLVFSTGNGSQKDCVTISAGTNTIDLVAVSRDFDLTISRERSYKTFLSALHTTSPTTPEKRPKRKGGRN